MEKNFFKASEVVLKKTDTGWEKRVSGRIALGTLFQSNLPSVFFVLWAENYKGYKQISLSCIRVYLDDYEIIEDNSSSNWKDYFFIKRFSKFINVSVKKGNLIGINDTLVRSEMGMKR